MNTPNKPHIPVFLASNDKFAPFVATTMASILANTREFIDFYVLDSGISKKNRQKIRDTRQYFDNFDIRFIPVNCDKEFGDLPRLKHITKDMYSRFLIPDILPDCEKVIYSDVDVAFVDDIAKLYNDDLGDKIIGAVPNYVADTAKIKNRLRLSDNVVPFMSGLLLINCRQWKQQHIIKDISTAAEKNSKYLLSPDQDILNIIFAQNYFKLDKKYCIIPKHIPDFERYRKSESITILHYAGVKTSKPWNNPDILGGEVFWKYVPLTAFEEDIKDIYRRFRQRQKIKSFFHAWFNIHNREITGQKFKVICLFGFKIRFRKK